MLVEQAVKDKPRTSRRGLAMVAASILALAAISIVFVAHSWPFTRESVTRALEDRSARTVTIDSFRKTFFPPGCVAEGVKFLRHEHPDKPAIITMRKLVVRGSYLGLLTKHVPVVQVVGMHVTVPPRGPGPDGKIRSVVPLTQGKGVRSIDIGTIVSDAVTLEFMSSNSTKEPYRLEIQKLELSKVGDKGPFSYRAMLFNPEPPGEIHATGTFGPWVPDDPGRTPVTGSYVLDNANLGVFKGIAGSLSSKGSFKGALDNIEVDGSTDVPAFHVGHSSHTIHLVNAFHALINGTDGDTRLTNVKSTFERTTVISDGTVAGKSERKGKFVNLTMTVHEGRIDDLLRIFVKSPRPQMTGVISLRAQVEVPPEQRPFLEKIRLDGEFGIGGGRFANVNNQAAINHLSESARGEKKEQQQLDPQTVLSNLKGHASVKNGIATLTNVSFGFPGALAHMHGTYNLINQHVDLHGILETDGKLSDTTSGFKSLMLKVINPFFKKKSASNKVKQIPFKITGTFGQPEVALEFGQKH